MRRGLILFRALRQLYPSIATTPGITHSPAAEKTVRIWPGRISDGLFDGFSGVRGKFSRKGVSEYEISEVEGLGWLKWRSFLIVVKVLDARKLVDETTTLCSGVYIWLALDVLQRNN